jgi:dTDP-4-dehydrorhamnose reductase
MRILVIGSGGQVGFELMRTSWAQGSRVSGISHNEIDVTDAAAVDSVLRSSRFSLVINAAAYTAVDRAEGDAQTAFAVNCDGAAHVAAASAHAGIPLIHLSTDYVFDGAKREPYVENDPVAPLNVYGASKAAGEDEVRRRADRHIIIRTSWVYGAHGRNFVKTMLRLGRQRREIRVVDDQIGSPTSAADLASSIAQICARLAMTADRWGTYHLSAEGATSWYGFAQRIFALRTNPEDGPILRPVSSAEFAAPARRPADSRLDCRRIGGAFGVACPPWQVGLARALPEIEASLT